MNIRKVLLEPIKSMRPIKQFDHKIELLGGLKVDALTCGCKSIRPCYKEMLQTLTFQGEAMCVEDAAMGTSTMIVYLLALQHYCKKLVRLNVSNYTTYESRNLYEVVIQPEKAEGDGTTENPIFVIDAAQRGGSETLGFALYIIEQLVACNENNDMLKRVTFVILPCVNPDGLEFGRVLFPSWRKNLKPADTNLTFGVDISRNFPTKWGTCVSASKYSQQYPGPKCCTENETLFVDSILLKYKNVKMYVSLRRDGHGIFYPPATEEPSKDKEGNMETVAKEVSGRVNQRAGAVQIFTANNIYRQNRKPYCGHSVDYAKQSGIPMAYEYRIFLNSDNNILKQYQTLPRGYENQLRLGYFAGIKELYYSIIRSKHSIP